MGVQEAGRTISAVTGGKFGNGAISAGLAYVTAAGAGVGARAGSDSPNFDKMSNQELADWIMEHRAELGIQVSDGANVTAIDEYVNWEKGLGWVNCSDALCGGALDKPYYGSYENNTLILFKPAFEAGPQTFAISRTDTRGAILTRPASAVANFGHEAAHSMGIDMIREMAPIHYNADRLGVEAMRRFRSQYEH